MMAIESASRKTSCFMLGMALATLGLWQNLLTPPVSFAQEQRVKPAQATIEKWMNEWMGISKTPVGTLHLSRLKDPVYFLTKQIGWKPNPDQESFQEVSVPKGFVTDLASIPRIFWSVLRPDGDYTYPAIIHDFLYWTQSFSREEADMVFKLGMEDFGVTSAEAMLIYNAVRLGGQSAWDENAEKKAAGEKRILKRFPQDPRISWKQWGKRPDVFAD